MKRFLMNFFLVVFYTATVSAANTNISRTIPTKNTNENPISESADSSSKNSVNTNRATVSRTTARAKPKTTNVGTNGAVRSVGTRKTGARATLSDGVNTVGRSARTESASINANPALRRAGIVVRPSTAEVGGRAIISGTNMQTGSNIDERVRAIHSRASLVSSSSKQKTVTAESLANAKDIMEKTSDLNSTCQQQYNECMDQFCAVVDANQKRCSCSANLAKYTKVQEAVEKANTELNDVAQQIRYVGLSADEIRAIMSATEAELAMSKTKDTTENRSMLDDIADMIKDPTSATTLNVSNTDSLLNMDFDFSSDNSDLFGLDMFSTSSNDISSKRGSALYNEAKKRCKTVLNQCKDAGGTENQIAGNYDLAIAKDCIAYEQGLDKLNQTLVNNVRSANLMLQKARLAVLQNHNEYDAKGCIGALETCMLDDMVCGENYVKCLDPTKVYIDENGKVVLGRNLPNITNMMTAYNNTNITKDFIKNSSNDTNCANNDGACIVNYLMKKIGTGANVKDGGLCRAVLEKCQDYTYVKTGKKSSYNPYNDVVVNYIQRAMVNIKAAQSKIISDYAATCMADVEDCYNQQNSQISSWSSSASVDNVYRVMTGACYNVALTCGYAVFAYDAEMGKKLDEIAKKYFDVTDDEELENKLNDLTYNEQKALEREQAPALISGISQMFYQSMLCPDNSTFAEESDTNKSRYVNDRCVCNDGYLVSGGACVSRCPSGKYLLEKDNKCVERCPDDTPYKYDGKCIFLDDGNCPNNAYLYGDTCYLQCPNGLYKNDYTCVAVCPEDKQYKYNDTCYASCPENTYLYEATKTCYADCYKDAGFYVYENKCVSNCSNIVNTSGIAYNWTSPRGSLCISTNTCMVCESDKFLQQENDGCACVDRETRQ